MREGVTIPGVLYKYFVADATPALRLGSLSLSLGMLLALTLAAAVVVAAVLALLRRRQTLAGLAPMVLLWVLCVVAPASWLVLSKVHSDIHSHLIPVLFQYSAVPASLALLGVLVAALFRAVRSIP